MKQGFFTGYRQSQTGGAKATNDLGLFGRSWINNTTGYAAEEKKLRLYLPAMAAISAIGVVVGVQGSSASDPDSAIYTSCKNELRLSDSGCECVVSKAKGLNEKEMAFFLAAISGDPQKMAAAQSGISGDEMMNVTNFMTATPSQCQNE